MSITVVVDTTKTFTVTISRVKLIELINADLKQNPMDYNGLTMIPASAGGCMTPDIAESYGDSLDSIDAITFEWREQV